MVTFARIQAARHKHLPTPYLVPIALLLILSFGCLFGLLFHLTNIQDEMERQREAEVVVNSVRSAQQQAERDLSDYAVWDQAVIHLVQKYDSVWAEDNLGPYLGREQDYDYVVVIDGADRPLYAYHRGQQRPQLDAARDLGISFASSLARVRDLNGSAPSLVTGFSRAGDDVYVYAVSSVLPLTQKVTLPSGRRTAMAIARKVDGAFFHELSKDYHGPTLHLTSGHARGLLNVPLRTKNGEQIGYLSWVPEKPGTALRKKIWPAFILAATLSLIFAGLILQRGRRALEALQFSETRAQHLAKHDLLTGLPNRRAMQEHLQEQLETNDRATLLYLDLDGFKETNDVYGHGAGDELLRAVTCRLREAIPASCFLARVGGDEFAIVAQTLPEGRRLAGAILSAFSVPFAIGGFRVSLGISVGLAANASIKSADELVRRSDAAMYVAKSHGKHCFQIYSPQIDASRELRRELEHDLQLAIERSEIDVLYQPIVSARSREVVCVEALARWQHVQRGAISPDRFIPLAEESGLIIPLGQLVLSNACRQSRSWNVNLAVNLSPAQFWDRRLANTIEQILSDTNFPADRLELEITEGYLMRRPEAARDVLKRLKDMGVRIALDDFGTGFASIGYLQKLGFDRIKIDRSFVAAALSTAKAADLARAIVAVGDALDLPVTAEGVESLDQAALMTSAGCERLQGWLFGRPSTSAQIGELLATKLRLAS